MGTTSNGLPYPEGTDPVAGGDDVIKALALALDAWVKDSGWQPIASTTVTSGVIRYRQLGKTAWIHIDGTLATALASGATVTVNTTALPAAIRPVGGNMRGSGYFGGFAGHISIDTSGVIQGTHQSGAPRGSISGIVPYPIG